MAVYSFHLATVRPSVTARALIRGPQQEEVPGLRHAECFALMELGAPIVSAARMQLRRLAMFAAWDAEDAVDDFLTGSEVGRALAEGWHVRMDFIRRWGRVSEFAGLPEQIGDADLDAPVVAVTLARLKLPQLPRFIRWGRPVERLVRDHPATTLALAAIRPPRTFSTFTVWRTARDMVEMVEGSSSMREPGRHADAMRERNRKDFHHEFTTLRFSARAEYGAWDGRSHIFPRSG